LGRPTKEFEVEVDPHKLEAYSVTVPQILTALGNANINVGGAKSASASSPSISAASA
jgi:Cu/Ag efflux pump CusA